MKWLLMTYCYIHGSVQYLVQPTLEKLRLVVDGNQQRDSQVYSEQRVRDFGALKET